MAITSQRGKPAATNLLKGKYALVRWWPDQASAATPTTGVEIDGIVNIDISEPSYAEEEIFQFGGGDDRTLIRTDFKITGSINCHKGKAGTVLSQLQSLTWSAAGDSILSTRFDSDNPHGHLELICRTSNNTTHLYTVVVQDMIIDPIAWGTGLDYSDQTIPFHGYHEAVVLALGCEFVYDVWTGSGSTVDFTASSTPLTCLTAANYTDFPLNNAIFIKTQASSASTGTRQKSGWSYSTGIYTATTAPTVGTKVQIGYVKAT